MRQSKAAGGSGEVAASQPHLAAASLKKCYGVMAEEEENVNKMS
jgi:uncharacterized membrane protein